MHRMAAHVFASGFWLDYLEHLLEARNMLLGLRMVFLEGRHRFCAAATILGRVDSIFLSAK